MKMKQKTRNRPVTSNHLLREARERLNLSQRELAKKLLLADARTIGRWEREGILPHPDHRRALCTFFEMSPAELGFLPPKIKQKQQKHLSENAATGRIWTIPPFFTSFCGREQELEQVCTYLRKPDIRLMTMLGPAGVGKTRLAVEIAHRMQNDFSDGVCFVPLASIQDPALFLITVAKELHIQENRDKTLTALLYDFLKEKYFLLILDNFEQIVSAGHIIERFLVACPNLKILVTSQAVLHLQAENEFRVEPLPLPPQDLLLKNIEQYPLVALFLQRVRSSLPNFQITQQSLQGIVQICTHLDGLPFAIELIAPRVKVFGMESLLEQIHARRFSLLKGHTLSSPAKPFSLFDALQWSYELLNRQEQWLFRHLSLFSGPWTLNTAEKMLESLTGNLAISVLDTVISLYDKSLLQRAQPEETALASFTMLETIREYGLHLLREQGEEERAKGVYTLYYLQYLGQAEKHLKSTEQLIWLARLENEKENLRSALAWLIERRTIEKALFFCDIFGNFCGLCGYWSEEQHWLSQVLELAEHAQPTIWLARILRRAGYLTYRFRNLDQAQAFLEKSVALSRDLDDLPNLAGALSSLGWVFYRQKNTAKTRQLLEEGVLVARRSGNPWCLANTLESISRFFYHQNFLPEALVLAHESVPLARKTGDKEALARILGTLVLIEIARDNLDQAALFAQESFELARELKNKPLIGIILDNFINISFSQQNFSYTLHLCQQRLQLAYEFNDKSAVAVVKLKLSEIALQQENLEQGLTEAQDSLLFFRKQHDYPNLAEALCVLADIQRRQRASEKALLLYQEALLVARDIGKGEILLRCIIGIAEIVFHCVGVEQAIGLLAFAEKQLASKAQIIGFQGKIFRNTLEHFRTQLSHKSFVRAWSKGFQLTFDEALAFCILQER